MTYATFPVSGGGGSGDVQGPASSTSNGIVLFDGVSGKIIKDGGIGSANQVLKTDGTTPSFGLIVNANVSSSAAIALDKLAAQTANRAVEFDASGFLVPSAITSTELSRLDGIGGNIQSQLNGKFSTSGGTLSGAVTINQIKTASGIDTLDPLLILFNSSQFATDAVQMIFRSDGVNNYNRAIISAEEDSAADSGRIIFGTAATGGTLTEAFRISDAQLVSFVNGVTVSATTNQLVLGTTNTTTVSATAPAASRVYTMPDVGGNADFVMTAGTQTIAGAKTFDDVVKFDVGGDGLTAAYEDGKIVVGNNSGAGANPIITSVTSTANAAGLSLVSRSNSSNTFTDQLYRVQDQSTGTALSGSSRAYDFQNHTTSLLTILRDGNVGIGTSSPGNLLEVSSATSHQVELSSSLNGSYVKLYWDVNNSGGAAADWSIGPNNNIFTLRGESTGTDVLTATQAGAVTLGPSTNTPYTSFHTTYKNIASGTPSSATDLQGMWSIAANAYWAAGYLPTRLSGLTGGRIGIQPRTSDTEFTFIFSANTTAHTATGTSAIAIGGATAQGAWTLGPSSGTFSTTHRAYVTSGATGAGLVADTTGTLANNQICYVGAAENGSSDAQIGTGKHSGITNATGFLFLREEDGASSYLWVDNAAQFRISSTFTNIGTTGGTVVGTQTSDERLKENITPISYGLDTVIKLEPLEFDMCGIHKLGFGAQRTLTVLPESVFDTREKPFGENEPSQLGMEYVQIIPVLVKAIQELKAELDALKGA